MAHSLLVESLENNLLFFPLLQQNRLSALLECLLFEEALEKLPQCVCSEVKGAAPEPRRSQKVWDDWWGQVRRYLDSIPINKCVVVRQLQLLKPTEGRRLSLQWVGSDRVQTRRWQSIKARNKQQNKIETTGWTIY